MVTAAMRQELLKPDLRRVPSSIRELTCGGSAEFFTYTREEFLDEFVHPDDGDSWRRVA